MDTNEVVYQGAMDEYVCCGVAPDSALRVRLLRLVLHRDFEMIVLVLIVGSSTCLALDHPLDPPTSLKAKVL